MGGCRGLFGAGGRVSAEAFPEQWRGSRPGLGPRRVRSPQAAHRIVPLRSTATLALSYYRSARIHRARREAGSGVPSIASLLAYETFRSLLVAGGPHFAFTLVRIAPTVPIARGGRFGKNATCRKESQGSAGGHGPD